MTGGNQFPDLRALNAEIPPPPRAPWWIRHSDLIAAALCVVILLFAGHAVGEF
jgi:hypothetical protein